MFKILMALVKRPDLSSEEFWERWHVGHGELSERLSPITGMRKYIQNRGIHADLSAQFAQPRGAPKPYDGFAEAWFDSFEAFTSAMATPEGKDAFQQLLEDEKRFLDHEKCVFTIVEENSIMGRDINTVAN